MALDSRVTFSETAPVPNTPQPAHLGRRAAFTAIAGAAVGAWALPQGADAATTATDQTVATLIATSKSRTHKALVAFLVHAVNAPSTVRQAFDQRYAHIHAPALTGHATLNGAPLCTQSTAEGIALVQALIHGS